LTATLSIGPSKTGRNEAKWKGRKEEFEKQKAAAQVKKKKKRPTAWPQTYWGPTAIQQGIPLKGVARCATMLLCDGRGRNRGRGNTRGSKSWATQFVKVTAGPRKSRREAKTVKKRGGVDLKEAAQAKIWETRRSKKGGGGGPKGKKVGD